MSEAENTKFVQDVYAAFGRGDIPAVVGAFAEDAEMHFYGPSEIPMAGVHRGHDGLGKLFQFIGESLDVQEFVPDEFIAWGEHVVVLGHERATVKATGQSWATNWAMVWTIRDGQAVLLREYHNTADMAAAFRS